MLTTHPVIATDIFILMCTSTCGVDACTIYAASALAANTVMHSLLGAVLPHVRQSIYDDGQGFGLNNSLLEMIAGFFASLEKLWPGFNANKF